MAVIASSIPFDTLSAAHLVDMFLLLLIGIGPKIALVPFLELTAGMPAETRQRVLRKMLTTAMVVAIALLALGGVLTRLLHFSTGALGIASGIILMILAVSMVLGRPNPGGEHGELESADPLRLAVYPLAVPYLLNPAGIVVLVTASAEAASWHVIAGVVAVLAVVLVLDVLVFSWANRISEHLDENRMLVTEKVFGFLLAALAVQLVLDGLSDVGVIHLTGH
jgi:multiple antibiotic resistance protein